MSNSSNLIYEADCFSFRPEFQTEILVACIQSPMFINKIGLLIESKFFENSSFSIIHSGIKKYFQTYKSLPNKINLLEFIPEKFVNENIKDIVENLYQYRFLDSNETNFISDKVKTFIQHQAMKKAIIESFPLIQDPDGYDEISAKIKDAMSIGTDITDIGIDAFDPNVFLDRCENRVNKTDLIGKIPTGFHIIDKFMESGIGGGELLTIMAPAKTGKSHFLVNVGANALIFKKNIIHISLEMPEERVAERYDMRMLGMTKNELRVGNLTVKKAKSLLDQNIGHLHIKSFARLTPEKLELHLRKHETITGEKIDMLLLDYADIMTCSTNYNQKRWELDAIYYDLRALAEEYNIPIITVTQSNRGSVEKLNGGSILDLDSMAESYGIARIVTACLSLNITNEDKLNHEGLMAWIANRYGEQGGTGKLYIDYSRCLMRDWQVGDGIEDDDETE